MYGDGVLSFEAPTGDEPEDRYRYDPANPVQTIGGGDCCNGGLVTAGAFDQRQIESRHDVLVYTSEPLEEAMEVSGFVDAVLKVSSSARDTDFARSEEHTSELQSLMRISYAVFCLQKKKPHAQQMYRIYAR